MTLDSYLLSIFVFGKKFKRTKPADVVSQCSWKKILSVDWSIASIGGRVFDRTEG